jgi:hypothetical protein
LTLLVLSLGLIGFALATAAEAKRSDRHWTAVAPPRVLRS